MQTHGLVFWQNNVMQQFSTDNNIQGSENVDICHQGNLHTTNYLKLKL